MKFGRSSGVLLHITSLPGKYGIGDLGPSAYEFADTLSEAGISWWQILPTGPVDPGMGYSPYASSSAFAGNFLMISPEEAASREWFDRAADEPEFPEDHFVNFDSVRISKIKFLRKAYGFFLKGDSKFISDYESFCSAEASWLDDYALFAALAAKFGTNDWRKWDAEFASREKSALDRYAAENSHETRFHKFVQYLFFTQWNKFKEYCSEKKIGLIGDIPIYITLEGADAWANPGLFLIDEAAGEPAGVAGVPPDYFSETGQRWGNPLYRWFGHDGALNEEVYQWWRQRISLLTRFVDVIRLDHFRGFESYWAIPAEEKTAVNGKWMTGPGLKFFQRLKSDLGELPIIAEDLGVITPEVEQLRDTLELPGMKILQFAFDMNSDNYYLPHNTITANCVLYTGTHDNNTANGWFYEGEVGGDGKKYIMDYIGFETESDFHWRLIRLAFMSIADLVVIPAQDLLGYGADFRMNKPGTASDNWGWRLTSGALTPEIFERIKYFGKIFARPRINYPLTTE